MTLTFILRAGITIKYQLHVDDVFSIRLETSCPLGTKPGIKLKDLRKRLYR